MEMIFKFVHVVMDSFRLPDKWHLVGEQSSNRERRNIFVFQSSMYFVPCSRQSERFSTGAVSVSSQTSSVKHSILTPVVRVLVKSSFYVITTALW